METLKMTQEEVYKAALALIPSSKFKAVPDISCGKNQKKFLLEVNSKLPNISVISDTVIDFFGLSFESVSLGVRTDPFTKFGLNPAAMHFDNLAHSHSDHITGYLEYMLDSIWRVVAKGVHPEKYRSLCEPQIYKLKLEDSQ